MSGTIQLLFFSCFQICLSLHKSISASECPADWLFVDTVAMVCLYAHGYNRVFNLSFGSGRLSRWELFHSCIPWLERIMAFWSGHLYVTNYFFVKIAYSSNFCHWNSPVFMCVAVLYTKFVATKFLHTYCQSSIPLYSSPENQYFQNCC